MKELTIITGNKDENHKYDIESASIINGKIVIVFKKDEIDDFLMDFIIKKHAYEIIINTDIVCVHYKTRVFAENFIHSGNLYSIFINILFKN